MKFFKFTGIGLIFLFFILATLVESKIQKNAPSVTLLLDDSVPMAKIEQLSPNSLNYEGYITKESNEKLVALLNENINEIRIKSLGGFAKASIELANIIRQKNIHIVVDEYCGSGCASVFLASKKKTLPVDALLLIHHSSDNLLSEEEKKLAIEGKLEIIPESENNLPISLKIDAREEYLMLFNAGISTDIYINALKKIKSNLKEKLEEKSFVISTEGTVQHFPDDISYQIKLRLRIFELLIKNKHFQVQTINASFHSNHYFPTKQFLLEQGVKGIESYAYPKNQDALNALMMKLDASGNNVAIGEF